MNFNLSVVKGIQLYQHTLGDWLPDRCRFTPTCSQYTLEACQRFGVKKGLRLGIARIKNCKRPYGGRDPVPSVFLQDLSHQKRKIKPQIRTRQFQKPKSNFVDYDREFKLILGVPVVWKFLSQASFQQQVNEYKRYMLKEQYALRFAIATLEAGVAGDGSNYAFKIAGTVDRDLLEQNTEEFEKIILTQFETFFGIACVAATQENRFRIVYASYNGVVVRQPESNEPIQPKNYHCDRDFWQATSGEDFWLSYLLLDLTTDIALLGVEAGLEGCLNSFAFTPEFQGCGDGVLHGCDGAGCDLGGCEGVGCFDGAGCGCSF
jgi:uncharacterized protein